MKLLPGSRIPRPGRRGAALMLTFMVMIVLILILAQIKYSTDTAGRVARNEETVIAMDLAIESALLQVYEDLKTDAESDSAGGAGGAAGDPLAAAAGEAGGQAGAPGAASESSAPTDSREDAWARPQRTEINEIQLRILIQDEDGKYNLLSILTGNEDEADKAFERLTRVIEFARKGTDSEIDGNDARRMATAIRDYLQRRSEQFLPRPELLSDDEDEEEIGLPLSLREFLAIDPELFPEDLFRDYRDEKEQVVHSLSAFLTVWSSLSTVDEADEEEQTAAPDPQDPDDEEPDINADSDGDGIIDSMDTDDGREGEGGESGEEGDPAADPDAPPGGQAPEPSEAPGWAINLNTAPPAVLHALMEPRALPYRFWDDVVTFRNEVDEDAEENEDPPLDEYGREITVKKIFRSTDDLSQIDGWVNLEPIVQGEVKGLLKTQSQVFSIYVTARRPTGQERVDPTSRQSDIEREEGEWQGLVRTVRSVVWRRVHDEGSVEIVPLVRWEVLDYVPFEVLDDPEQRDGR